MNLHFFKTVFTNRQLEHLLLAMILLLCAASLLFLIFLLIKRAIKLVKIDRKQAYRRTVEQLLFELMFHQINLAEAIIRYQELPQRTLFKKILIHSIVMLHRNYSGLQKSILEDFYFASGLSNYSLKKVQSVSWQHIVEGIRDLSALNVQEARTVIRRFLIHPNAMVRKEALIGLITMEGVQILQQEEISHTYMDDWTQSCILYNLKTKQVSQFGDLSFLLQADNPSMVLLGARIIDYFQQYAFYPAVLAVDNRPFSAKYVQDLNHIKNRIKPYTLS